MTAAAATSPSVAASSTPHVQNSTASAPTSPPRQPPGREADEERQQQGHDRHGEHSPAVVVGRGAIVLVHGRMTGVPQSTSSDFAGPAETVAFTSMVNGPTDPSFQVAVMVTVETPGSTPW